MYLANCCSRFTCQDVIVQNKFQTRGTPKIKTQASSHVLVSFTPITPHECLTQQRSATTKYNDQNKCQINAWDAKQKKYGKFSQDCQLHTNYTASTLGTITTSSPHTARNAVLMGPPRHEGSTREAAPSRARRADQNEALPGSSAVRGGPQLQLSPRQLKT